MKCPYCNQDHPDDIEICPNTGKPLGQSALGASAQGSQSVTQAEIEMAAQTDQPQTMLTQVPIEFPTTPINQLTEQNQDEKNTQVHGEPQQSSSEAYKAETLHPEQAAGVSPDETTTTKQRNTLAWVLGGCLGIPLFVLLILALLVFLDPFDLHVVGRINGKYDAAAEVMPADTGIYLGINIGNALLTHVDRSVGPFFPAEQSGQTTTSLGFLSAPAKPKPAQQANPLDELLQQIQKETGINIPEDISPWVGQYAGFGVMDFEDTDYGAQVPTGWILAVEARNLARSDAFLETLQTNLVDLQAMSFDRQTYKDVNIFSQKKYTGEYKISFGRYGRIVLVASSPDTIKEAIDRRTDQALSEEKDYIGLIGLRPRDWSASLYINHEWIGDAVDTLVQNSVPSGLELINPYSGMDWTGILLNASAIRQGIRFDIYSDMAAPTQSADAAQILNTFSPSEDLLQMLPQNTLFYLASSRIDQLTQGILNQSFPDEYEKGNFLQSLEQSLGFDMEEDLVNKLNGPWALYAVPSSRGLLPTQSDLNLAVSLLAQTEAGMNLQPITDGLKSIGPSGGIVITEREQQGLTYYEISTFGDENPILAFGASGDYFTLGTDSQVLRLVSMEGDTLLNASGYQEAIGALTTGLKPYIYIDIENLFANLREGMEASDRESFNDSISFFEPVGAIVLSSRILPSNIMHSSIVLTLADQ